MDELAVNETRHQLLSLDHQHLEASGWCPWRGNLAHAAGREGGQDVIWADVGACGKSQGYEN
jgi:hypothetical protein